MATVGIDGIISGMNTSSLISQLMAVETQPQTLLKSKQTDANNLISALQSMNTKVSSLADSAKAVTAPSNWASAKAASSATSVTAATSSTSQAGTVTFTVDKVAQAQTALATSSALGGGTTFTVKVGANLTTVKALSSDPRDIAAAINNAAGSGVVASTVRTGVGADGKPTYTLQLSSASTGKDNGFTLYAGTSDDVTAGSATEVATQRIQDGVDAQITLYAGTDAETTLTSASNTFTGLLTGTDVTVAKVETDPVTVTVTRDPNKIASNVASMFGALSVVFSEITSRTASTTTTNSDGSTSVKGGLLSGDSTILSLQFALSSAASSPVGGTHSPSEMGVNVDKDGNFTFDQAAFTKAYNADPAKVQSWMNELAGRVQTVAARASDPVTGAITQEITGENSVVKALSDQITNWDGILAMKQQALQTMFTDMESRLATLQSQQSYLTSQLSSLPSWS